jgi:predicted anti-sigma-YlaC factor YlaD
MSDHRPDYDRLSAHIEGTLSHDATRWLELHLKKCETCRVALEREKRFLEQIGSLRSIQPPPDFTEGVMARVAQQPAYQPPAEVPWRKVAGWSVALAASLVAVLGLGVWVAISSDAVAGADATGLLSRAITGLAEISSFLISTVGSFLSPAMALAKAGGTIVLRLFDLARNSGLAVQLGVLLATVTLNYVFTRMVLNYQRRQ